MNYEVHFQELRYFELNNSLMTTIIIKYDYCQQLTALKFMRHLNKLRSACRFLRKVKPKFTFNICHIHQAG